MQVSETRKYGILKLQKNPKKVMILKKNFVFIISFILLYTVFQILSGVILTAFYTPDLSAIETTISQEVAFGKASSMPLIVTMLIATYAYFLSQKYLKLEKVKLLEE
ncbi:hypothetical protein [Metabacillus litoralis]|uniref:hypothetical protein n=1 Tax=Metabacillus litoralis TaxID=152268 RepID=UPI00203D1E5D|nr:hypothetical protein [Metabacillus litoralis]MCM3654392.1 hypothetical protein [Metabacillus litoralis]